MSKRILPDTLSIQTLNAMQEEAWNAIEQQDQVLLLSPTGSGKTLAFLLPCVQLLDPSASGVQLLVIVPSRELALQTEQVLRKITRAYKISCCYGGHAMSTERNNLLEAPAVLIATPGRLAHHTEAGNVRLGRVHMLVLDEFDKSLEAGFEEDMAYILSQCSALKKRILTSATDLSEIPPFVGLKEETRLDFISGSRKTGSKLEMKFVKVPGDDKLEALMLLLGKLGGRPTIVFCNHREAVDRISRQLREFGIAHGVYHGGLEQADREKALIRLRQQSVTILVSTDLAARGLDIPEIAHVIHYQLPLTEDGMVHRNGRTARMHAEGSVYFLLDQEDRLPSYLEPAPAEEQLPTAFRNIPEAAWTTLYVSAGKKEKIGKGDIVGMLIQKGGLAKEAIGRIDVLDHSAYVAVQTSVVKALLGHVQQEKIKNTKVRIAVAG